MISLDCTDILTIIHHALLVITNLLMSFIGPGYKVRVMPVYRTYIQDQH